MIDRDAPRALKIQFTLWVTAFIVVGCLAAWFGASDAIAAWRAAGAGAATVEFWPASVMGLPLAMTFLAFAAMALMPKAKATTPTKRRGKTPKHSTAVSVLFAVACCGIPLTFLAPAIGRAVMSSTMEKRDYRLCRTSPWTRHPTLRWNRVDTPCP